MWDKSNRLQDMRESYACNSMKSILSDLMEIIFNMDKFLNTWAKIMMVVF